MGLDGIATFLMIWKLVRRRGSSRGEAFDRMKQLLEPQSQALTLETANPGAPGNVEKLLVQDGLLYFVVACVFMCL